MKLITYDQIGKIFNKKYPNLINVWRFDSQYCAPSLQEFEDVMAEIEPIRVQFEVELFDCDDYALVMSAFVKLKAVHKFPKGLTFGEITVRRDVPGTHTLNVLITEDDKIHYYEPQGNTFVRGQNYNPFFVRI